MANIPVSHNVYIYTFVCQVSAIIDVSERMKIMYFMFLIMVSILIFVTISFVWYIHHTKHKLAKELRSKLLFSLNLSEEDIKLTGSGLLLSPYAISRFQQDQHFPKIIDIETRIVSYIRYYKGKSHVRIPIFPSVHMDIPPELLKGDILLLPFIFNKYHHRYCNTYHKINLRTSDKDLIVVPAMNSTATIDILAHTIRVWNRGNETFTFPIDPEKVVIIEDSTITFTSNSTQYKYVPDDSQKNILWTLKN